jgi:esterase/lipase superfamily enzyme
MSSRSRKWRLSLIGALLSCALGGCLSDGMVLVEGHVNNAVSFVSPPQGEPLRVPLFVASTRRGDGARDKDGKAHFSLIAIGVPPGHRAGSIERPSFGSSDPRRHFVVLDRSKMEESEFLGEIAAHVSGRVGVSRDILLYVHGFNTNLEEARFREAQIVADGHFSGVPILFSWNTRGGLFNYESDRESATVARDALEKLIVDLSHTPGVGRVHILAHSMGAWLTMESLRSIAISGHPDLDGRLGNLMLAAPDIDLNVFRQQVARLDPKHVSIFVASDDRALSLSSRIAGDRPRLGALDPTDPKDKAELDRLGVAVHDISGLSSDFVGHGAFAEAPKIVRQIGAQLTAPRQAEANTQAIIDVGDATDRPPTNSSGLTASRQAIESQPLPPLPK